MNNFENWYSDLLALTQAEGLNFDDSDSVRADFEAGKSAQEVADEIIAEYRD